MASSLLPEIEEDATVCGESCGFYAFEFILLTLNLCFDFYSGRFTTSKLIPNQDNNISRNNNNDIHLAIHGLYK